MLLRGIHLRPKHFFWALVAILCVATVCLSIYVYSTVAGELASLEQLENPKSDLATTVMSEDGEILEHFFVQRRTYIGRDSIPEDFINALIATEDRSFYDHWGIDTYGIARALVRNIIGGHPEGASTITQQLARNLYLNHDRKLERKVREAFTAIQIEQHYTKPEILELYANTVYFGRGAYGLQIAAHIFFNKSPLELSLPECAYLVGVLKNPYRYSSTSKLAPGLRRRNIVLFCMKAVGVISEQSYREALDTPLAFAEPEETIQSRSIAPHFVEMVRQEMNNHPVLERKNLDLYSDGLVIHTTLNAEMQRLANAAVGEHIAKLQKTFNRRWKWKRHSKLLAGLLTEYAKESKAYKTADKASRPAILDSLKANEDFVAFVKSEATRIQVGFPILDVATGKIRALVGSSKFGISERYTLNRAKQIYRQPGSAFKPFLYTTVLEKDYLSPDSLVECGEFSYRPPGTEEDWVLQPHKRYTTGSISLGTAIQFSINTVAGRLITEYVSPQEVREVAKAMGISTPLQPVPAMALGSEVVSPLELTAAFGVYPNRGVLVKPYTITRIEDRFGNTIYNGSRSVKASGAISEKVAAQMVRMLQKVIQGGTAVRVRSIFTSKNAAGKTGTTNDYADAWFVGFTPQLVAGVWVGFDNIRIKFPNDDGQGGRAAAPIWARFMQKVYKSPLLNFDAATPFDIAEVNSDIALNQPAQVQSPAVSVPENRNVQPPDETLTEEEVILQSIIRSTKAREARDSGSDTGTSKQVDVKPLRSYRRHIDSIRSHPAATPVKSDKPLPRIK